MQKIITVTLIKMDKIYYIIDENGFLISYNYYQEKPDNSTDVPLNQTFIRPKFNGSVWTEGATEEEIFNSREIPNEVPLWCVKAILHEMDLLQTVEGALSQLGEPTKSRANYIWNYGNIIKRDSQTVDFIGQVLQKSKIEIDEIFINADKIEL